MVSKSKEKEKREAPRRKLIPVWTPQLGPQTDAITADWCPILFYGGAKYGGKSDFMLGDYLQDVPKYKEHWQGILFRRSYKQFTDLITRSKQLFPRCGAEWKKGDSEWHFREGSILRFRYLESLDDIEQYWGHSYPWIGVDELGEWEDKVAFFRLFTNLRYGAAPIPTKRIRASGNPGGPGHQWVKEYFIDPAPKGYEPIWDEELQMHRLFIPASMEDNIAGLENDPGYEARMNRAGSPELVKAWRYGLWDIVAGAFFPELGQGHKIRPFDIPQHWARYRAMDWGACGEGDPFTIGWFAISDGSLPFFPPDTIVCYRVWHGRGLPKQIATDVADGIRMREAKDPPMMYSVAGGDIEQERGLGVTIFERFNQRGVYFRRADMRRAHGANEVRQRIVGKNSKPSIYFVDGETDALFDCLQTLQHDPKNLNDCLQKNDDPYDMLRYFCMSRPFMTKEPPKPEDAKGIEAMTFNKAIEMEKRYKQNGRL